MDHKSELFHIYQWALQIATAVLSAVASIWHKDQDQERWAKFAIMNYITIFKIWKNNTTLSLPLICLKNNSSNFLTNLTFHIVEVAIYPAVLLCSIYPAQDI